MAIIRQQNFLGEMRLDIPMLRAIESSVAGDFQTLAGTLMAGGQALVAYGARILDVGAVGTPAPSLLLRMGGTVLLHSTAAEAGAIFTVPSTQMDDVLNSTNSSVVGAFSPSVWNYVSLDLVRSADLSTQDLVVFRSASTLEEFSQIVPLGRILAYKIYITVSDFGANPSYCPIAKVLTDSNNNVVQIVDCRQMYWRLGLGGVTPDPLAKYSWDNRNENTSSSDFTGGDKDIGSQLEFNRAVMQRLWELGGGEHWYASADDRSVQLVYDNSLIFPDTGENWYWTGTDLLWRGLSYWFAYSTGTENLIADAITPTPGLTDLDDGEVIYVDLDRTANSTITPYKASWGTLSLPLTPGSRHILAWRQNDKIYVGQQNQEVNIGGIHAQNTSFGTVKLFTSFAPIPEDPVVPVMDADSAIILADPAALANVVARGITRDSNGTLRLGCGIHDTAINIAAVGVPTSILGPLTAYSYNTDNEYKSTGIVQLLSGVVNGAGATACTINTVNSLTNPTAKILSLKNFGSEKAYFDKDGKLFGPSLEVTSATTTGDFRCIGTTQVDTGILASSLTTASAVALNVGTATCSSVTVGRTGINTTIAGSCIVSTPTLGTHAVTKDYADTRELGVVSYLLQVSSAGALVNSKPSGLTGVTVSKPGTGQYRITDARITTSSAALITAIGSGTDKLGNVGTVGSTTIDVYTFVANTGTAIDVPFFVLVYI